MRVNIYNTGVTRFLEYLGPGNHMNVEVSPGILRLLGKTGTRFYPVSQDPNMRVRTTSNTVQTPITSVPVQTATPTPVDRPVQQVMNESQTHTEKNPQVMRPSDMKGTNTNGVRFGKQVSDAGEVVNDDFFAAEQNIQETAPVREKPQRLSARDIANSFKPEVDDLDVVKNESLRDLAAKRQAELEKGINTNRQQPQAVDWEAFDRQYMAEKEAAEKAAAAEKSSSSTVVDDIDVALNTFAENGGHFDTVETVSAPQETIAEEVSVSEADVDALIDNLLLQVQTEAPSEVDTGAIYREAMGLDENTTEVSAVKKHKGGAPVRTVIIDPEVAKSTVYTKKEMKTMTNKTLASILTGRGYTSGKLRPIPQDSKDKLIAKVLQTQEDKK